MINILFLISSIALAQSGEELYQTRGCATCHEQQIAGCPDLTLLKEDDKVAGVLDLSPENISKWLEDPQGVKPGTAMPPSGLDEERRMALANWLIDEKSSPEAAAAPKQTRPEPKLDYEQVAYPLAGIWTISMFAFFWTVSRLGSE